MVCQQHPSIILTGITVAIIAPLFTRIAENQSINTDSIVSTVDLSTLTTDITVLYIILMLLSTLYIIVR